MQASSADLPSPVAGPDRRVRALYVTRNSEYHLCGGVCVAVRDRASGHFLLRHAALERPFLGAVRLDRALEPRPVARPPRVGDALIFGQGPAELVTSNLLSISRPDRTALGLYPA